MSHVDKGLQELKDRGLAHITWNQARDMYHNGMIGQDDYELYLDVWNSAAWHFSVPDYQVESSRKRLQERYKQE